LRPSPKSDGLRHTVRPERPRFNEGPNIDSDTDPDTDRGIFYSSDEDTLVHEWPRDQLQFLGVPEVVAESVADAFPPT
jgi:hypothetical protein